MTLKKFLPLLLLGALAGCSDQRATYEINGSAHALSLIRVTDFPWDQNAKYSIVAARMPDCMRKHPMGNAPLNAKVEVFSPGNDAWIVRLNGRMFVTETRTCEGFAALDKVPEDGLGTPIGVFELRNDTLVFSPAQAAVIPAPAQAPAPDVGSAPASAVEPAAAAPAAKN